MKAIAINGSPRKGWNTHILLNKALEGAASQGYETELINLFDFDFKGCISCLACKHKSGASLGACALQDNLTPVLKKIAECDMLFIGSPIYFGEVTGAVRSFIERLMFQYLSYEKGVDLGLGRQIPTLLIYTMNAPESILDKIGYTDKFTAYEQLFARFIGPAETLICAETLQVEDYSKYYMGSINGETRAQRRLEVFPSDCQKAFDRAVSIIQAKSV